MRVLITGRKHWGLLSHARELAPEFDVRPVLDDYLSHDELQRGYPAGWRPDVLIHWGLDYNPVPRGIEQADCFTVAVVGDWNVAGQSVQLLGDAFDLILTDQPGSEALKQAGIRNVRPALLWGFMPEIHRRIEGIQRDIDILFVGNPNPELQAERSAWLGRVAQLADEYKVVITQAPAFEYAQLMNRARIAFNRGIRGEMNLRAYEAPACGALMFYERDNREVRQVLTDRQECVLYGEDDLESLLRHYLGSEPERARLAEAGCAKVQLYSAAHCLRRILESVRNWRAEIGVTQRPFRSLGSVDRDVRRLWNWTVTPNAGSVQAASEALPNLAAADDRPDVLNATGVVSALAARRRQGSAPDSAQQLRDIAAQCWRRALELTPDYAVASYNLAYLAYDQGDFASAAGEFRRATAILSNSSLRMDQLLGPYCRSLGWSAAQVEMERVWAWNQFGAPAWLNGVRSVLLWDALSKLSDIAFKTRDFSQAAGHARQAQAIVPFSFTSYVRLGRTLAMSGELQDAAQAFLTSLQIAPTAEQLWLEALPLLRAIGHPLYAHKLQIAARIARAMPSFVALRAWLTGEGLPVEAPVL